MIKNPRIALHLRGMYDKYIGVRPVLIELGRLIAEEYEAKTRSTKQNAYYWGVVISVFVECTGYTKEEAHEELVLRFLPKRQKKVGDKVYELPAKTSTLSTKDFNEQLTEPARLWIIEYFNADVPLPNEPPMEAYND